MRFPGKGDDQRVRPRVGKLVDVEGVVPASGDEEVVRGRVNYAADRLGVFRQDGLLARGEVDLLDLSVHACGIGFIVGGIAEADV